MRKGFTLIELLTVVAIIGVLTAVATFGLGAGNKLSRMRGASRDVFATIRQARSIALVSQEPCILSYSNEPFGDGGTRARIRIVSAKLISGGQHDVVKTLSGREIRLGGEETSQVGNGVEEASDSSTGGGESVENILFSEMDAELLENVRVFAVKDDDASVSDDGENVKQKSKISAFSNVDYLLEKYNRPKDRTSEENADGQKTEPETAAPPSDGAMPAKVDVVWEVNGRCEPHKVWVYLDGMSREDGVCIRVDRFGSVRVLSEEDGE